MDSNKPVATATTPTVIVPEVTGQAFTFAKGALEDSGFAWKVVGPVQGFAANRVLSQSPLGGTKLKDTGAPTVTLTLSRSTYAETGQPADVSPYVGTAVVSAQQSVASQVPKQTLPAASKPAGTPSVARPTAATKPATTQPVTPSATNGPSAHANARPPAFVVAGAPKEPLKEMPLADRAQLLSSWLGSHQKPTNAAVRHFLYQQAWVITGAKFGWWHGAQALKLLIVADQKAERLWGIGHKSELAARNALAEVEARSR